MSTLKITAVEARPDDDVYRVTVTDADGSRTEHLVAIKHAHKERLGASTIPAERILDASFAFLLEREPKESIFRAFDLTEVNDYFHEFDTVLTRRLRDAS